MIPQDRRHQPGRDDPLNEMPPGKITCPNCREDTPLEKPCCIHCGRDRYRAPFEEYLAWLPDLRTEAEKSKRLTVWEHGAILALVDDLHGILTRASLRIQPERR